MKRFLVILIPLFLSISQISFAGSLDYKGLEKISKNNTFMDGEGLPYPDDKITDKKNTLLIIFNHGSSADAKRDVCSKKAKVGKIGSAGLVPAIASLHNKKINNLEIKIYRLCSGVIGFPVKTSVKYYDQFKAKGKIELVDEFKQMRRQNIIINKVEEFKNSGFENIVLAGWSAGGWASLNLQSRFPDKVKGAIAFNPAFAGPKREWSKQYPQWGEFRKLQINIIKSANSLKGILFSHAKDNFETPETLAFFKEFDGLTFIDYSEVDCDKGHWMPRKKCFTDYVEKNNYLVTFLENIF